MLDIILRQISILRKGYQIYSQLSSFMHNILVDVVTLNASLQLKLVHCTAAGEASPSAAHYK